MPKLTKRKTGETFTFTTSKAMGKRIRHEADFRGMSVSEFIRKAVGHQVSPNVPVEGSSFLAAPASQVVNKCPPLKIDETHRVFVIADDKCPENEFVTICLGSAAGKTVYVGKRLSGDTRSDGRKRVDTIDAGGAVVQSNFSTP